MCSYIFCSFYVSFAYFIYFFMVIWFLLLCTIFFSFTSAVKLFIVSYAPMFRSMYCLSTFKHKQQQQQPKYYRFLFRCGLIVCMMHGHNSVTMTMFDFPHPNLCVQKCLVDLRRNSWYFLFDPIYFIPFVPIQISSEYALEWHLFYFSFFCW
jgi:hypothetical protein